MRLRFGELSADEQRERENILANANAAWLCLRAGEVERARQQLAAIDARVELVISAGAEGTPPHAALSPLEASAWPLAELMLAQAPSDVGYALSLGRSALPLPEALAEVRASHGLELERATLRAGFGRGHLLEVTLGVPGGVAAENEQNAAENLVRAVLGDRVFETWIGAVHVVPAPRFPSLRVLDVRAPKVELHVHELFATVAAAVLGVLQGLPTAPHARAELASDALDPANSVDDAASREDWTLLEVEPVSGARGHGKDDLVLASTCTPELLRCYLDGSPCASRRFSRAGEQFVFLSYADDERTLERRVARRTLIEGALSEAVAGIGAVTGVGFGVQTTYVDLALCDLEAGLARLVAKLKQLEVPAQSYLQFFDSELAEEWLSIWPHSRLNEG